MLSIKSNVVNEIIIKKSRFITFLFRVDNEAEIKKYLDDLSNNYKDSTHICYAYILDNVKRFNDDGELEKMQILGKEILSQLEILGFKDIDLNVLENKDLNHILCCIVRYFGGIKLGANGLVRAYSNGCSDALDCSELVSLLPGKICSIKFKYDDTKIVDSILRDCFIIDKKYEDDVTYVFKIGTDSLSSIISNSFDLKIIEDCYIEKGL